MAAAIARLYAELDLKNQKFKKGSDEVVRDSGRMQKAMGGVLSSAKKVAVGLAAVGAVATIAGGMLAKGAISAASDLSETISKTNAVFGSNAEAMLKWGETAATSVGLSKQAALEAASTLGNLLKGVGVANKDLPIMSENIVQAAADLGSFNNVDPAQVVEDLRSGLVGEAEPLRKYGILINEAAVKAKGLELGLADANGELSEGAKVQARYALIMDQIGDAQGDFAKTSGGLANGTRILHANLDNLRAMIGMKLLPIVTKFVAALNAIFAEVENLRSSGLSTFRALGQAISVAFYDAFGKRAANAVLRFFDLLRMVGQGFRVVGKTVWGFIKPFAGLVKWFRIFRKDGLNPVSGGLKALGTALHRFRSESKPLTRIVNDLGRAIAYVAQAIHDLLSGNPDKAIKHLGDSFGFLWDAIRTAFTLIPWKTIGETLWNGVTGIFTGIPWGTIGSLLWQGAQGALDFLVMTGTPYLAGKAWEFISSLWSGIDWSGSVGPAIWTGLQTAFTFVTDTSPSWLAEQGMKLLNALFALDFAQIGGNIWAGIKTAFGFVVEQAVAGGTYLAEQGYALLKGLWSLDWGKVATDVWNGLWTALQMVKGLGGIAIDAIVDLAGDLKAIRDDAGTWIRDALGWSGDKTIQVGKVILQGDVNLEDTGGGEGKGGGKSLTDRVTGFVKNLPNAVNDAIDATFATGEALGKGAGVIVGKLVDAMILVMTSTEIQDKLVVAMNTTLQAIANAAAAPFAFAGALLAGIASGLELQYEQYVGLPLRQMAAAMVNEVKKALGISSPSTVFAGIGLDVIAGLQSAFDFNSIFNFFWSIGRAITGGMISGISSLWSAYAAQIDALIAKAREIKSALGVASPSKFMANVGANYVRGMVVGIQKGLPELERTIGAVTASAMGGVGTPSLATRAVTPAAAMATGGGGRLVKFENHNHFPEGVTDPEALAQLSAKYTLQAIRRQQAGAA